MDNTANSFANADYKGLSKYLMTLSPIEFASIGSIIGLIITASLTNAEQNTIGNFLELVGQVILTAQAQGSMFQPTSVSKTDFEKYQSYIEKKFNIIIKKLDNINK